MSRIYAPGGFPATLATRSGPGGCNSDPLDPARTIFPGWVPFDIELLGWSGKNHFTLASVVAQNRVGGSVVGPPLGLAPGQRYGTMFDAPIPVPAVTSLNIDTAARWGLDLTGICQTTFLWNYQAVNDADAGRQIMSIGGTHLLRATSASGSFGGEANYFAPLVSPFQTESIDAHAGPYFTLPYETLADLQTAVQAGNTGERRNAATVPWAVPGLMGGFRLVCNAAPTANFEVAFRQNKATVFTITVTAGATRIFTPSGDPTVTINQNDLLCWQCLTAGGDLDAQLLWWFARDLSTRGGFNTAGFNTVGFGQGGPV